MGILVSCIFGRSAQESDPAPIFGDWSHSEKISDIKPPLEEFQELGNEQGN